MIDKFNFKLETFADPGWNLVFQRGSTISKEIKTNAEVYSSNPDLFVLIDKAKTICPTDFASLNLEKVRTWYLLIAKDEEWFHKETFELSSWDNKFSAFINLDYLFDDYEQDYEIRLEKLGQILKAAKASSEMKLNGELIVRLAAKSIEDVVDALNDIVTEFTPKKTSLPLDKNWTIFLGRLGKFLQSASVKMPPIENAYSFNRLSFMNLLSYGIDNLQRKEGKEPILLELSTLLTFLKSNPSVGDDLNSQLAELNRFLNLQLLDWSKFS